MGNKNELLQKIDGGYSKFSKGQKKLADFIKEDYDKAAFLTDMTAIRDSRKRWARWSVPN